MGSALATIRRHTLVLLALVRHCGGHHHHRGLSRDCDQALLPDQHLSSQPFGRCWARNKGCCCGRGGGPCWLCPPWLRKPCHGIFFCKGRLATPDTFKDSLPINIYLQLQLMMYNFILIAYNGC